MMSLFCTLLGWLRGPGWRGHLLALAAGVLTTLSFTPFDLWPLGLVSIALLYQGVLQLEGRQALWRGWWWGLGLFLSGVSWVYISIHVHGSAPPPLAALLTGGLVAGLALIPALTIWIWVRWLRPNTAPWRACLGFAALWVGQEFFRSWFLTGFPWLFQGYAHTDTWLAGWAPLGGVWLLSFLTVFTACLCSEWKLWRRPAHGLLAGALLISIWGGGALLAQVEWTRSAGEPLSVAMVQADIEQSRKWDPAHIDYTLATYRDMSYELPATTDIIVWPETAVPVLSSSAQPFVQSIAANLAQQGTTLITGIPVDQVDDEGQLRIYNGIMVAGDKPNQYLKHKLVPFGEYVPLEDVLRGLIAFFDLPMSSFSRGPLKQEPLYAADHSLAPLICYETVYPDFAARLAARSDLLITISNDSWFGESIGPLQHLQMARMRALESGREMIRGTNNGVTALIDHQGRITAQIPQFQQLTLRGQVQPREGLTPWLRWGNWPLSSLMGVALLLCLAKRRNN